MKETSHTLATSTWPTLQGRLQHALTTREEAVRQLQTTMQITPLAKSVLSRSKGGSYVGRRKTKG